MRRHLCIAAICIASITLFGVPAIALKPSSDAGFEASAALRYEIVRTLPHARSDFTQGLEICDGTMIESVGLYGVSALIRKDIDSGEALQRYRLPPAFFAEGATCADDYIYQLSWRERTAVVYDRQLQPRAVLHYEGEGWGLTHDGEHLIMSDGSATLSFRRRDDFSIVRTIEVHDGARAVERLNELEYAHGLILANIWQSDRIAAIDPADGAVLAWLDLSALTQHIEHGSDWDATDNVLNGIAHDAARDRYYVTGKRWPVMYELRLAKLPRPRATAGDVPRR